MDEILKLATAMALEKRAKYIVVDTEEEGLVTFDPARKLAGALVNIRVKKIRQD